MSFTLNLSKAFREISMLACKVLTKGMSHYRCKVSKNNFILFALVGHSNWIHDIKLRKHSLIWYKVFATFSTKVQVSANANDGLHTNQIKSNHNILYSWCNIVQRKKLSNTNYLQYNLQGFAAKTQSTII